MPLKCLFGWRATNMCSHKPLTTSMTRHYVVFHQNLASSTWNYVFISRDGLLCTQPHHPPWMQPNRLPFPHHILPLYLDYSGAKYTSALICHSDFPQDVPDVACQKKKKIQTKKILYWDNIIWMYYHYTEFHAKEHQVITKIKTYDIQYGLLGSSEVHILNRFILNACRWIRGNKWWLQQRVLEAPHFEEIASLEEIVLYIS